MTGAPSVLHIASGLSDHQRLFFESYGFLQLGGLFADEIEAVSRAFDETFDNPANPRIAFEHVGHRNGTRETMPGFLERHPGLIGLASDPRLVEVARDLLDPTAVYAESDGNIYPCETEWHFDAPTSWPDHRHLKMAFYLDSLTGETGAPRVLPGSHRLPGPLESYLGYDGRTEARTGLSGEDLPHWALCNEPGDVLVWDYRLMHASFGSTKPRRQFAINFRGGEPLMPALEDVEADRLGPLQTELASLGLVALRSDEVGRLRREAGSFRRWAKMDEAAD